MAQTKPQVRRRLEELRLVEAQAEREKLTIGNLVERYLKDLTVTPRTLIDYRKHLRPLIDFFTHEADAKTVTKGDADRFLRWLKVQPKKRGNGTLAPNYVSKMVKTMRQAFAAAVADNLLDENPIAGLYAPEQISDEDDYEITRELTERILTAANPRYRLIIALARYGGLRCPSELAGMCWSHFYWDKGRFLILSPKTQKQGKPSRIAPIFRELLPFLLDAYEMAPEGQEKVFPGIDGDSNLRTELIRTLKRAGISDTIPSFYRNCRSSRQTELEEEFSLHVVCKWLGNTEKVARRHYLKVRDSHFAQASGAGVSPSVQKVTATCSTDSQEVSSVQIKTLETNESPAYAMCGEWSLQERKHSTILLVI